jgi:exosortase A
MSTLTVSGKQAGPAILRLWSMTAVILAAGAAAFCIVFQDELRRALVVWDESTAYNHCYLIVPITAYLIWERRRALLARSPQSMVWPIAAMIPVGFVWLVALQANIMEGRQLAAMGLFELFLLALLGFQAWRVIAFALLYLFFLVPVGAFMTPMLQDIAASFAVHGVKLTGIPVYSDGLNIEVPGARFVVAEACAGLRFLIASVAFGALYGYLMYQSWQRRAAFIAVSMVVPIIANGFRVMGIVILGYWIGDAKAAVADHLIYGWVFFSMVTISLILLGQPFRQPPVAFAVTPGKSGKTAHSPTRILAAAAVSVGFVAILASPMVSDGPIGHGVGSIVAGFKSALGH